MCSSIQSSSTSSCSGVKPTAPRTPRPPALLTATTTSRQWVKAKIGNSMPRVFARSVCMGGAPSGGSAGAGSTGSGLEPHRQVLDAVDEVGAHAAGLAGQFDVGEAAQELPHHDLDL